MGYSVLGVVNKSSAHIKHHAYSEICTDLSGQKITELERIPGCFHLLIHCAAYVPSGQCPDSLLAAANNIQISLNLINFFVKSSCQNFVFISSASVYADYARYSEINEANLADNGLKESKWMYSEYKKFIEKTLIMYCHRAGKKYCILRPTNIYGYCRDFLSSTQFIPSIVRRINTGNDQIFSNVKGEHRDFIHASDVAAAIELLFKKGLKNTCYTISSGVNYTLDAVIQLISNEMGDPVGITILDDDIHRPNLEYDSSKLRSEVEWLPVLDLKSGIRRIISDCGIKCYQ